MLASSGSAIAGGGGPQLAACYGTKASVKYLSNPVRILDTRYAVGVATAGAVPAASTTVVSTSAAIPGAIGVIGNVTVTGAVSPGYLTVFTSGTNPLASTINFSAGGTIANHTHAALASDGTFRIYNSAITREIFDVTAGIYPVSKALRMIDKFTETCASDETEVTWTATPTYQSFTPTCALNVPGSLSVTPVDMGTLGTFYKSDTATSVVIDWGGHVTAATVSNVLNFYLKVDGVSAAGGQASGLLFSQDAGRYIYMPMHAVFQGLATGLHSVDMWVSIPNGSASGVIENPGCYSETVVVQEG